MSPAAAGTSIRMLYPFASVLQDEGVPLSDLLAASGIDPAVYADPEARIAYAEAGRFIRAAEERTSQPALGLAAARHLDQAQFHVFEYLASSSEDVGNAAIGLVRHQRLLSDVSVLTVEVHGDQLVLRYDLGGQRVQRSGLEFVIGGIMLTGARAITPVAPPRRADSSPACAWFAYPEPKGAGDAYRAFFQSRVRFDAPVTGIATPQSSVHHPMTRANPEMHAMLEDKVADMVSRVAAHDSIANRARAELSSSLADPELGLEWLASRLHMSRTTLKRKLAAEGTSFSKVIDEVRRERALAYLRDPGLDLQEVAFLLGYGDVSSLHKACRRWTGRSPASLRGGSMGTRPPGGLSDPGDR